MNVTNVNNIDISGFLTFPTSSNITENNDKSFGPASLAPKQQFLLRNNKCDKSEILPELPIRHLFVCN